jgi:hypothetical protein
MKSRLCLIFLFGILSFSEVLGQGLPIEQRKSRFFQNDRLLKNRQMLEIMQAYPEAYESMRKAKSNADVASVFGFAGGFMVGWTLGGLIGQGEPTWGLGATGVGLILVAIPFSSAYTKHAGNAVSLYNSQISGSSRKEFDLKLGMGSNGIGLRLSF